MLQCWMLKRIVGSNISRNTHHRITELFALRSPSLQPLGWAWVLESSWAAVIFSYTGGNITKSGQHLHDLHRRMQPRRHIHATSIHMLAQTPLTNRPSQLVATTLVNANGTRSNIWIHMIHMIDWCCVSSMMMIMIIMFIIKVLDRFWTACCRTCNIIYIYVIIRWCLRHLPGGLEAQLLEISLCTWDVFSSFSQVEN